MTRLGAAFSVVAAVLAGIGIYGLLSYTLQQRRREIGIRLALGARPTDIARMTVARTLALGSIGAATGMAGSIVTAKLLGSLLFQASAWDLWANIASVGIVIATALAATLMPVVRAARVDPSTALRY